MVLSYGVTVCNEIVEIERLLRQLLDNKREQDEIVVLYDKANGHEDIPELACSLHAEYDSPKMEFYQDRFNNHFADWKNKLTSYCTGDYIFQIDADEYLHKNLLVNLPAVLESNPDTEFFWVPRVNTVEGLTQEDIQRWRWNVSDKGWVNYPDMQPRIYKRKDEIVWKNKVHEQLEGYKTFAALPAEESWSLYHPKDIDRQRKQNEFYSTL